MKIEEALIRLRDDLKEWITNNLNAVGGGGSSNIEYVTKAEYEALPDSKLSDDVEYRITDANTSNTFASTDIAYDSGTVKDALDSLNESLNSLHITQSSLQTTTKQCAYGTYVDYFSYTPSEDTFVKVWATTELNELVNHNGTTTLQIYSTNTNESFVNMADYKNPYTANIGKLSLILDNFFLAKAGVTYNIRVFQATTSSASYSLKTNLCSNVKWNVL